MVEEAEEGEEESKGRSPSSPSSIPPSPRNHHLPAPNSRKKANDLPGLSSCHSCGLYCPSKLGADKLQTLDSQWRVVVLCKRCLGRIRSAEACSYCFSSISEDDGRLLDCRDCSRRIHLRCVPLERGYVALSELHPDCFTCVDCCPFLKPRHRNPTSVDSRFSFEDLVKDASAAAEKKAMAAARAREKVQRKAAAARHAAVRARNALEAVVAIEQPASSSDRVLPDEELALQLHRAMNGSQRILRNPHPTNPDHSVGSKKMRGSGNSTGRKAESGSCSSCEKVEFCTEDKGFFESMEKWLNWSCPTIELDSNEKKDQMKEINGHSENSLVEVHVKEEQGDYYDSIGFISVSCQRADESNGTMVLSECGGDALEYSSESQQKERCGTSDRYMKKYSKRHSSFKGIMDEESQLVPCRQMSCSEASRTLPDAGYQSSTVPVHSSPYASLPGCQ